MREIFYLVNYGEHLQAHTTEIKKSKFYEVKLELQKIVAFPGAI
jgi:hypothetical protein